MGKRESSLASPPKISARCSHQSWCNVFPFQGPCLTTLCASTRSTISHDSPIFFPAEQFLSKAPFQLATAPDPLHENRLKEKRLGEHSFHSAARVTREARFVRHRSLITMRGLNFRRDSQVLAPGLALDGGNVLWLDRSDVGRTYLALSRAASALVDSRDFAAGDRAGASLRPQSGAPDRVRDSCQSAFSGGSFPGKLILDAGGLRLFPAALFAFADEFHQAFVPSRTSSLGDVAIDYAGVIIGLALLPLHLGSGQAEITRHRTRDCSIHPRRRLIFSERQNSRSS